MSVQPISVLSNWGSLVALWAPVYLVLLDQFGHGVAARSDALEWSLVVVGVLGTGTALYLAWRDTRNPEWRAAHGLLRRPRSKVAGH